MDGSLRELAKEYPLPNEEELIRELLALREKRVVRGPTGAFVRESHPKHHGCVRAEFVVEPDLAEELRVGVFAQPRTFPAWIRFSNASPLGRRGRYRADGRPDVRGMAVKLMGVEGDKLLEEERNAATQDFLLVSADALVARNLEDFVRVLGEFRAGPLLRFFLDPREPHLRELAIAVRSPKRHANPLEIEYFSIVPFLLGERAVKYAARPVPERRTRAPWRGSRDFLREAMQRELASRGAEFEFLLQLQTDPDAMPIEDPSVVWDSPYRKVATIRVPPQRFDSPEHLEACENLSFTPWHSLPEHRPLGGLNRAREAVYRALSQLRHERNGIRPREPA